MALGIALLSTRDGAYRRHCTLARDKRDTHLWDGHYRKQAGEFIKLARGGELDTDSCNGLFDTGGQGECQSGALSI